MTKPHGSALDVYPNGVVTVQGVDYGGRMTVVERNDECIVIRVASHKRWAGRGSTVYEPPRLLVFAIVSEHPDDRGSQTLRLRVKGLVEISLARKVAQSC